MSVCCMENLGEISKTQTVGWNINRLLGSLVFTVPDLHISSWLFLYSLYCISPRDCCFVTFCTIVLAGFVLHTVLKKIPHYSLPFFFSIFISSRTIPHRGLSSSSSWFGCTWTLIVCLQPSAMCLLHGMTCRCAAALVNGHNKWHCTKEVSDEQLWTSRIYLGGRGNTQLNCKIGGKWHYPCTNRIQIRDLSHP